MFDYKKSVLVLVDVIESAGAKINGASKAKVYYRSAKLMKDSAEHSVKIKMLKLQKSGKLGYLVYNPSVNLGAAAGVLDLHQVGLGHQYMLHAIVCLFVSLL